MTVTVTDDEDLTQVPLPPATDRRGVPGHDQALERATGAKLLADRSFGFTYEQMAQRHGYADGSGARQALLRALDRHEADKANHLRHIENERYELDQATLRAIIADPEATPAMRIRAIDARTRAAARHARLNGLDAPVQVQLSAGIQAELHDALTELGEQLGVVPGEVLNYADEHPPPDPEPQEG